MPEYRRIHVTNVGDVCVVRFRDQKIIEDINIQEWGQELFSLVDTEKRQKILLNFTGVEFADVGSLNVERLAPGGHAGRLTVWTESAFKKLDELYA